MSGFYCSIQEPVFTLTPKPEYFHLSHSTIKGGIKSPFMVSSFHCWCNQWQILQVRSHPSNLWQCSFSGSAFPKWAQGACGAQIARTCPIPFSCLNSHVITHPVSLTRVEEREERTETFRMSYFHRLCHQILTREFSGPSTAKSMETYETDIWDIHG